MRRIASGILVLIAGTVLFAFAARTWSQPPERQPLRPNNADQRRAGGERGRGGFPFPPPPVMTALDQDGNGEISQAELQNAATSLRTLDKNSDGELANAELMPAFGRGRGGRGGRFGGSPSGPRRSPEQIKFEDGVAAIPDHATYHKLSYKGEEVMIDTFLSGLEFVKFTLDQAGSDEQQLYFINTKTHRAHMMFARVAGLPFGRGGDQMKGVLVYRPMLKSPNGEPGLYTFEFEPFDAYSFAMVKTCQDMLIEKMPVLKGKIGYYPRGDGALERSEGERALYDRSDVKLYLDEDISGSDVGYLALNPGESFGRLRLMNLDDRPSPRDVVLYKSLPNEMPRVAGIITAVRQTPLSHVNLRAVQDKVPNSFITNATKNESVKNLIGKFVSYKVSVDGYQLREATADEVEAHFADIRPRAQQVPLRDLSVTKIRSLDEIEFKDSSSVGVKAANLATLRTFGLPEGTAPDGFAVPFYFYDQFMTHNGFYEYAKELLANDEFQKDQEAQVTQLKKFRSLIKKGKMPGWMIEAVGELQSSFSEGASIRCRSSTNNEDLPGFSGAGLYDSYTHHPQEGHLSKSLKQVFASLWNFRAFEEREFYRVDHLAAAMGVLVHRNYKGELANGVAVTDDILYQTNGNYYLNSQVGEDLVTNPEQASIPEEILLDWWDASKVQRMRASNRADGGNSLLSRTHLEQLRSGLGRIHGKFARLYGKSLEDENFAMEIEFKVTKEGQLAIKQARPWVYAPASN